jgi:hypothetical protein
VEEEGSSINERVAGRARLNALNALSPSRVDPFPTVERSTLHSPALFLSVRVWCLPEPVRRAEESELSVRDLRHTSRADRLTSAHTRTTALLSSYIVRGTMPVSKTPVRTRACRCARRCATSLAYHPNANEAHSRECEHRSVHVSAGVPPRRSHAWD